MLNHHGYRELMIDTSSAGIGQSVISSIAATSLVPETWFIDLPLPKQVDDRHAKPMPHKQCIAVERRARSQASPQLWQKMRKTMVISSQIHLIIHHRGVSTDIMSTTHAGRDLSHVPAIAHSRCYEDAAQQDCVSAHWEHWAETSTMRLTGPPRVLTH